MIYIDCEMITTVGSANIHLLNMDTTKRKDKKRKERHVFRGIKTPRAYSLLVSCCSHQVAPETSLTIQSDVHSLAKLLT